MERPIIFPWDLGDLSENTRTQYLSRNKFILEYAGLVDPKLMCHRKRPDDLTVKIQKDEIKRGMEAFIKKSIEDPNYAKQTVKGFIESQKPRVERKEITGGFIQVCLSPVKLALDLNEVPIMWRNLSRLIPSYNKVGTDRPYNLEEIRTIKAHASLHIQVAILLMASAGVRAGAFDYLEVRDIIPIEKEKKVLCCKVIVYRGEKEAYKSLASREFYETFQKYLKVRKARGENLSPESPAIVTRDFKRRLDSKSIKKMVNDILWKSGLRTEKKKRHEVETDHGFRKAFNNIANDHMEKVYVEQLMGHISGNRIAEMLQVARHYDRDLGDRAIAQYLECQPYLSIDESYRNEAQLSNKLEKLEGEQDSKLKDLEHELLKERDVRRTLQEKQAELTSDMVRMKELWEELRRRGQLK